MAVSGNQHASVLRLTANDRFPQTRQVRLGRSKSLQIEMPVELRDVMVSSPDIVDVMVQSASRVFLIGKKQGQSNAFFFDSFGQQLLVLEITVDQDTSSLEATLNRLISGARIRVEALNNTIILTGTVRNPVDATRANEIASKYAQHTDPGHPAQLVNMLAVSAEEQVMLKVVVAEVQREAMKQLGVNLGAAVTSGAFQTTVLSDTALPLTSAAGLGKLPQMAVDVTAAALASGLRAYNTGPAPNTFSNSGATSAWSSGDTRIAGAIRAMERQGLLRTLAEPNLTAISGEAAKFRAGGKFPIIVPLKEGQTGVEFQEYGVYVAFTPVVQSEQRISLKIETEVSELTNVGAVSISGYSIPALKTREAKSTVELPSGGSLAMAGLLADDVRQNVEGFPGLKDLPVLGTLFRSKDYIGRQTELVVLVTAFVVRPTARANLATPVDGLAPADDLRGSFLGHLNRIYRRELPVREPNGRTTWFFAE